jgi:hypothetical protein
MNQPNGVLADGLQNRRGDKRGTPCNQTILNGSVMLYTCTFGLYNQTTPWDDLQSLSWPALTTVLTEHHVGPKEGTCIVPVIFSGTKRRDADAQRIDVAFLDRER